MSIVAYVLAVLVLVVVIRGALALIDMGRQERRDWPDSPPDVPSARIERR